MVPMEALGANLRFGAAVSLVGGAGEPLCERNGGAVAAFLCIGIVEVDSLPSASSSTSKLSFGVPALRFFLRGGSGGVELLY